MKRILYVVIGAILILIGLSVVSQAQTFEKNEDASGNNRDLTIQGNPTVVERSWKFGDGINYEGSQSDKYNSTDSAFSLESDLSITFAFNESDDVGSMLSAITGSETLYFDISITTAGRVEFADHDGTTIRICSSDKINDTSEVTSGWITRNERTLLSDIVDIRLFNETGGIVSDVSCNLTGDANPQGIYEQFQISGYQVYEVRIWDQLVSEDTLDQIANPTVNNFTLTPEGTELALYYLEAIDPAGEPTADNTIGIYIPDDIRVDEDFIVYAELYNNNGFKVQSNNFTLYIHHLSTNGVNTTEYFNISSGNYENFVIGNEMEGVTTSLFRIELPSGLPRSGQYSLQVVSSTGEVGNEQTTTETTLMHVEPSLVTMAIEIGPYNSSNLIELAIWGSLILFFIWKEWIFAALTSSLAFFNPIFTNVGVDYPIGFTGGIFLTVLAVWLHFASNKFMDPNKEKTDGRMRDDRLNRRR